MRTIAKIETQKCSVTLIDNYVVDGEVRLVCNHCKQEAGDKDAIKSYKQFNPKVRRKKPVSVDAGPVYNNTVHG